MPTRLLKVPRRVVVLVVVAASAMLTLCAWDSQCGPPFEPWHAYVPADMHAAEIDRSDWAGYLRHEEAVFRAVRREVVDRIDPQTAAPGNCYWVGSPIHTLGAGGDVDAVAHQVVALHHDVADMDADAQRQASRCVGLLDGSRPPSLPAPRSRTRPGSHHPLT